MSYNALPYYPRYPRDFFDGTAGMTLEAKGAYSMLLDLIYMMGKRGLPDDPHYIAGHLGCSVRKWNTIRRSLLDAGKIYSDLGIISNKRADKEKIIQSKYRDNRAQNGRGHNKNKDLQKHVPPSFPDTDTDTEVRGGGGSAREAENLTFRETLNKLCGADPVSGFTGRGSGRLGTEAQMVTVKKWMFDLHLTKDQILDEIKFVMSKKTDGPPGSFSFFNKPMERLAGNLAAASNQQLTPTSTTGGTRNERAKQQHQQFDDTLRETTRRLRAGEIDLGTDDESPW